MRVLQAMAGAEFGGAEAFFVRLVLALHRAGLEQKVVIRENPRRAAALRAGGIEPVQLPFGGTFDFATGFAFKREVKAFRPQVAMTWMNRATKACPKGDFVHVGRLGGYYDLKYYRHCQHLIGNTEDIVEYLVKQGWPTERAHYLPNFVSEEKARPLSRKEFYTPDSAPLVLAMGRLHENKAFDVLLQAVARVPDIYLWLAGEGPLRADLEKQANHLGIKPRVRFMGWREDTAALLATCDLFVCPSRHEPLGNVVLEAWAQGVPVVAADSVGPGMLIDHMVNGVLVPVDDAISMGKAIRHVLEDNVFRSAIANAGRAAYEQGFTEQRVVERYLSFFQQVTS
ncbi:MAG: glycosyltransferase [Magnetospirillum sp. WYHS-4]